MIEIKEEEEVALTSIRKFGITTTNQGKIYFRNKNKRYTQTAVLRFEGRKKG